jgi:hypothetical protein
MVTAPDHEDEKSDLQQRTREPTPVHYPIHRLRDPNFRQAYLSLNRCATSFSAARIDSRNQLSLLFLYWLQRLARHRGMGSLPSATTTACCARIEELLGRELDGIAQYNPASATVVSKTFSTVFIGGGLLTRISARGEVYARTKLLRSKISVDHSDFLMVCAAAESSASRGKRPNPGKSHHVG